ncbi:tRNA-binding protein Pbp11 [Thermococcus gorgonarius]|uniref:Translation factor n=1 Tax=Thermococcus gorgonarius TaxID=71997 RepID=A0A2Z2M6W5_THEGO|nr:tRNA-binding protein Pbp11 [Thermococcus gorgonarius]ASJ00085.1 translation factor [Thermococcus gorgonarius]
MGFLDRLFRRGSKDENPLEIVSRKPVGKFRVEKSLTVWGRQVLIGEVLEGVVYPAYKVKADRKVAIIYRIEKEHRDVEFAAPGDRVALILEGRIKVKKNDEIEVYQS